MFNKTPKIEVQEKDVEQHKLQTPLKQKSSKRLLLVVCTVLGVVAIGLAVGLGVGLTRRNNSDDSSPDPSSSTSVPVSTSCPYDLSQPSNFSKTPTSSNQWWKPAVNTSWQIVLNPDGSTPNLTYNYTMYDLDLFDNPASTFTDLHSRGKRVICYFSAGSYENWRPDAPCFTSQDKGTGLDGWAGEKWLDTDSQNVRNIMLARLDLAVSKGCDGVDPDNVDGYDNSNGLGLTEAQAISYVSFLADAAHSRNLSVGLKNAGSIASAVIDKMDWEVNEECIAQQNCGDYSIFLPAGKPVFNIEYPPENHNNDNWTTAEESDRCKAASDPQNDAVGFSTVLKKPSLDEWIMTCN